MNHKFLTMAAISCMTFAALTSCGGKEEVANPFLTAYDTTYEIPPFEQIKPEHYIPALKAGIEQQNAAIDSILNNSETPTFENTILAYEESSEIITKVAMVFFALTESDSSDELIKVAEEFEPMLSQHSDEISMNP
ncbi:MAG: peptidase M3, partial [Muribaculaceae bacterium]